ncbi:MAG: PH domain-containing protein [Natronospirillum sp.]
MATTDNPRLKTDQFPPLTDQHFERVAPAYRAQLRVQLLPWLLVPAAAWWTLPYWAPDFTAPALVHTAVGTLPALLLAVLMLLWVLRRYAHTGYCVRAADLHLRTGALWQRTLSVALNRIQHLEITQGPLERSLGIARLKIYTAGGSGYDLMLPGLPEATAERLKEHLLQHLTPPAGPSDSNGATPPPPPSP